MARQKQNKKERFARIREGAFIANCLQQNHTVEETATALGISVTSVKNIECLALYKIAKRIRELGFTLDDINPDNKTPRSYGHPLHKPNRPIHDNPPNDL